MALALGRRALWRRALSAPRAPRGSAALSGGLSKLERTDSFSGVSKKKVGAKRTAEDAVNNILYNTPAASTQVKNRHILSCLVDNEPGVLSKVSGLLSARGFNIDSLTVSATDVKELSRMTIVLVGPDMQVEQAARQLEDLCDVWAVVDYKGQNILERELAVVKVNCVPPKEGEKEVPKLTGRTKVKAMSYDDMMATHFHRQAVLEIGKMFGATVSDIGSESVILELVAWNARVDAFIRMMQPYGIIEAARSGTIAMSRSKVGGGDSSIKEERTIVDLSSLPPS
jgi:acetolactate synthase-1/3 small subunit